MSSIDNILKKNPVMQTSRRINSTHWPIIFPFILISVFILVNNNIYGQQNVNTDIQHINLAVFDAKNLELDISYQVWMDDAIQSQMECVVKKTGNMVYQQTGSITIIKKEPYCLFIDSERKLMVLDPYYPNDNKINRDDILHLNVDSLKPYIWSTDTHEKGNDREYIFTLKKGQFSKVILDFNTKTFFLNKVEMYKREHYRDQLGEVHIVKMLMLFNRIDNKAAIPESAFDIKGYVNIDAKNKKAQAVANYKSYKLNSNIDKSVKFK